MLQLNSKTGLICQGNTRNINLRMSGKILQAYESKAYFSQDKGSLQITHIDSKNFSGLS